MLTHPVVTISEEAAQKLSILLAEESAPGLALRVYVESGGCSGLSYGMAFDDRISTDDEVIEQHGVKIIVDANSAPHLRGSEIEYVNSLMGGGFRVNNPNAVQSCSCGSSFDTGEGAGSAKSCCG